MKLLALVRMFAAMAFLATSGVASAPSALALDLPSPAGERQLLQQFGKIEGRCRVPDQRACTVEQSHGRMVVKGQAIIRWAGAISIFGMLALVFLFFLIRGTVRIDDGRSGRALTRFSTFERFVHWMTAACFV